jgi:hypothetical protein
MRCPHCGEDTDREPKGDPKELAGLLARALEGDDPILKAWAGKVVRDMLRPSMLDAVRSKVDE